MPNPESLLQLHEIAWYCKSVGKWQNRCWTMVPNNTMPEVQPRRPQLNLSHGCSKHSSEIRDSRGKLRITLTCAYPSWALDWDRHYSEHVPERYIRYGTDCGGWQVVVLNVVYNKMLLLLPRPRNSYSEPKSREMKKHANIFVQFFVLICHEDACELVLIPCKKQPQNLLLGLEVSI